MKISIGLAVYNGEKYLQDQLDSYLLQTQYPQELVICDDCSSDNSVKIIKEFKKIAPFDVLIYENDNNLGFTKNFEKVLSLCSGSIIFLSDQDDVWSSNKIRTISRVFEKNLEVMAVIHSGYLSNKTLEFIGNDKLSQIMRGYGSDQVFVTGALSAFRKELVEFALPFPANLVSHDGYLHYIAKVMGKRIVLKDILQTIRRHENNTSEWIVNSLEKINRFDALNAQFKSPVAENYNDRLEINQAAQKVFHSKKMRSNLDSKSLRNALSFLKKEKIAIKKRNSLVHKSSFIGKIHAISMMLRGDYRYFNGFKSFIRDLMR
jgi:glycosyltransferase involved in cell wall biosynthesis